MRQYLLSAALGIAALVLASPVHAADKGNGGSSHSGRQGSSPSSLYTSYHGGSSSGFKGQFKGHSYPSQYGKKFSHGYCYPGKNHCHWSYTCWSSRYGCNCYWCPYTCCWYYWCPSATCYYPMSYIGSAPPVVTAPPLATATATATATASAGAAAVPPVGPDGGPFRP